MISKSLKNTFFGGLGIYRLVTEYCLAYARLLFQFPALQKIKPNQTKIFIHPTRNRMNVGNLQISLSLQIRIKLSNKFFINTEKTQNYFRTICLCSMIKSLKAA